MNRMAEKAAGLANEAIGKVKQGIGAAVGSEETQARGAAQDAKGQAQQAGAAADDESREARIRERAYQLWEDEGCPHGRDQIHWEQASSEIDGAD